MALRFRPVVFWSIRHGTLAIRFLNPKLFFAIPSRGDLFPSIPP